MSIATDRGSDETRPAPARMPRALPFLVLAALLALWCWSVWRSPVYSPDSWAYYELSQSIRDGGYRLLGLRSYVYPAAAPSGAFPPLWPGLWSLVAALSGLGARAGLVASFGCAAAAAGLSEAIGRRVSGVKWIGLAAAAALFAMPDFAEEVQAARSIPLQIALAAALIWIWVRPGPLTFLRASAMGALCGALVMTRFDMMAFAAFFGLTILLGSRSLGAAARFGVTFLAAVSPWVTVSWLRFRELFHSDSSFVASAADAQTFVTDWYPPGHAPATVASAPAAWAAKVAGNVPPFLEAVASSPGFVGLSALTVALAALVLGRSPAVTPARPDAAGARRLAAVAPAVAAPLPVYLVTGYFDARYFSLAFWYLLLATAVSAAIAWKARVGRERVEARTMLLAIALLLIGGYADAARGLARPPEPLFPDLREFARMEACLRHMGARPSDRLLFNDNTLAARWAAVRHLPSATLPRNFTQPGLSLDDKRRFLDQYDIRFLAGDPEVLEPIFKPLLESPTAPCGMALYRLSPANPGAPPPSRL